MAAEGSLMHYRPERWPLVVLPLASAIFAYLLTFQAPFTPILNESDHHMFLYEGMRLLDGHVMYRDFFQFTFPGSQAWYWMMFAVFGLSYWILPLTVVLMAAAWALVTTLVSRELIPGRLHLVPAILLIFFGFRWDGLDGTHRMFSPIFVMLAAWTMLRFRGKAALITAGTLCATASFFTQQRGAAAVVAIAIFVVIEARSHRKSGVQTSAAMAAIGISFLISLAILCGYFIIQAGSAEFFTATISYPAKYYRYAVYNNPEVLTSEIRHILSAHSASTILESAVSAFYLLVLPFGYVLFWIRFVRTRWSRDRSLPGGITLVALIGTAMTLFTTAPNTSRLYQVAMPGLVVFCWLIAELLKARPNPLLKSVVVGAALCAVVLGSVQVFRVQNTRFATMETPSGIIAYVPSAIIDERYLPLLESTRPGDMIFEAYQPYIYFPLHLRNPTKYGQIWPSDYTRPEHVAETVADLEEKKPKFILWNNDYNKAREARSHGDHIQPLADLVQRRYRPDGREINIPEGRIQIWRLIE